MVSQVYYCQYFRAYVAVKPTPRKNSADPNLRFQRLMNTSILCQLVFPAPPRCLQGGPRGIGDYFDPAKKPLASPDVRVAEPLIFYKGMPILGVHGYAGGGALSANYHERYVQQCLDLQKWNETVFDLTDEKRMTDLMNEFLALVRGRLYSDHLEFLTSQLKGTPIPGAAPKQP